MVATNLQSLPNPYLFFLVLLRFSRHTHAIRAMNGQKFTRVRSSKFLDLECLTKDISLPELALPMSYVRRTPATLASAPVPVGSVLGYRGGSHFTNRQTHGLFYFILFSHSFGSALFLSFFQRDDRSI